MLKVDYSKVRYGYAGINYNTRKLANYTSSWSSKSGVSHTVTVNGPKLECVSGGVYYNVWGEGAAHVKRGNSGWTTSHKVLECGTGWFM